MKPSSIRFRYFVAAALAAVSFLWTAGTARAHCDSTRGPVIPEAQAALAAGDVTPVLKWVQPSDEAEIKAAFAKTIAVRGQGPEAQELADRYLLETLIRLHRAGEGAPYAGITDAPVKRIVALADQALADGSADGMIERMSGHMATAIREKFDAAMEAKNHRDDSVEAGRAYVEAYVAYVHYVEGIHAAIMSAGGHGHAGTGKGEAPKPSPHETHAH
jgi:hypothetical protein